MYFELLPPADQLVMIMERIYGYGMTTTSGGNLSILDENGDIWITPGGVDKGSLTRDDMVCVKSDGTIVGKHKPSSEFPFHKMMYETRSAQKTNCSTIIQKTYPCLKTPCFYRCFSLKIR